MHTKYPNSELLPLHGIPAIQKLHNWLDSHAKGCRHLSAFIYLNTEASAILAYRKPKPVEDHAAHAEKPIAFSHRRELDQSAN